MNPPNKFGRTELSLENCIIPADRLENTPSSRDNVPRALETDLRIVGCEYIQLAGLLLKLPQVAMATAQVLFQRFYYSKSFVKFSIQPMAMASIFLAAKIEEDCRRLRDVINVFHHLKQKLRGRPIVPMEYMGEEYFKLKNQVIKFERFLLKELGFCVHVKHPHKLIITYLQILEMEKNRQLAQRAWDLMNDSLRTSVFVRFTPETIACACIFLAARQLQIPLPQRPPWWLVFDTKSEDIEAISVEVLALYKHPKRYLEDLEKEIAILREKKQVEVKEIQVKKANSKASSANPSPTGVSPSTTEASQQEKTTSKSPATLVKSNSSRSLPVSQNSNSNSQLRPVSPSQDWESKLRGKTPTSPRQSRSRSPTPPHRRLSSSSPSDRSRSRSRGNSPHSRVHIPKAYKAIYSPIKISSDSHTDRSGSGSPHIRENGIRDHHTRESDYDRKIRRSRHKHHREKPREHHRHHHRDRESRQLERSGHHSKSHARRPDQYRHR